MIYIAAPYNHKDQSVRADRFNEVNRYCGKLINKGYIIFSPISHSHPIYEEFNCKLKIDWLQYDSYFLRFCSEMHVLKLDNWKKSVGIKFEVDLAKQLQIPIFYISV